MPSCPQCSTENASASRFCGGCGALLGSGGEGGAEGDRWQGQVVDARYRVLGRLGSGGMGVVYRVEHVRLGKIAAMKVLAAEMAGNDEMVRRFRLEAQAVSRLNHPNIVHTFDFGQWNGALYLIMEYVKGEDLAALLAREGAMPFARAARLFVQVCSALTDAHDAGIIHRDLKPENLMVIRRRDGSEHAKVLDFGLAKLREREGAPGISSGTQVLGTPYYMSPEQVRGETLDPRADVYSLGATLYRVLTGTPPFSAPSPMGVLAKHITDDVEPPRMRAPDRALPSDADRIVLRAMAKSVEERHGSAAELQSDLERALAQSPKEEVASPAPAPEAPVVRRAIGDAPTIALDEHEQPIGTEGGDRLRRQDVDAFERSLRRRRVLRNVVLPVGILGAVAIAVVTVMRFSAEKAVNAEREPNNTPGYANLLPLGLPVRGSIGELIEGGQADLDFFRVPAGPGTRAVSARLEGIPGLDLIVELFDSQGRRVAKSDAHGQGWGEWLQPTSIGPTEAYLAVREVWIQGEKPSERPNDNYLLTVKWGAPQPGAEIEPNDWEAVATPTTSGQAIRGYLGDPDDKDWFAIMPAATGKLHVQVTPPAGVDVVLIPASGTAGAPDQKKNVNKHGPGEAEELVLDGVMGRPSLVVVERKIGARKDPKDQALAGLDQPYLLRADLAE